MRILPVSALIGLSILCSVTRLTNSTTANPSSVLLKSHSVLANAAHPQSRSTLGWLTPSLALTRSAGLGITFNLAPPVAVNDFYTVHGGSQLTPLQNDSAGGQSIHIESFTQPAHGSVSYQYDSLGRRIQRTTSAGANERYVHDGQDVLQDLNADGSVAKTYLNGPGLDNHLRQTSSTTGVFYYLTDHLGSTTGLTDASGNVVEQQVYDSFGNSNGSSLTRYTYTGREFDSDTGLYYYRARWYDAQAGRFVSEDPIGFGGGDINLYGYVWQSPLNNTDPLGLDGWGNDFADWLDQPIERGRQYFQPDPHAVYWNTAINYAANTYHGIADMFRVGSGTGQALYGPQDNGSGLQQTLR